MWLQALKLTYLHAVGFLLQMQQQVDEEQPQTDFRSVWESRRQLSTNLEERRRIVAQGMMTDQSSRQDVPPIYTGDSTRYDKGMIPGYTGMCACTGYLTKTNDSMKCTLPETASLFALCFSIVTPLVLCCC